ncbi:hypothetical protein MBLNU13_g01802t1 [Cladosporium sp. NU13]
MLTLPPALERVENVAVGNSNHFSWYTFQDALGRLAYFRSERRRQCEAKFDRQDFAFHSHTLLTHNHDNDNDDNIASGHSLLLSSSFVVAVPLRRNTTIGQCAFRLRRRNTAANAPASTPSAWLMEPQDFSDGDYTLRALVCQRRTHGYSSDDTSLSLSSAPAYGATPAAASCSSMASTDGHGQGGGYGGQGKAAASGREHQLYLELVTNFESDNTHAYIQTTLKASDQKRLNTADGTPYILDFLFCGRFKKLRISLFARTTLKTAARAGVSFWSSGFIKKLGISLFARSTMKTAGASPWISWFVKKLGISLFARNTFKTAARADMSLRFSGFAKKLGISLFARTTFKTVAHAGLTAARAGVSFHAATAVAPIRKDEASKEDSIHVVSYEKGQRRERDMEADEIKPDIVTTLHRCNGGA